MGIYGLLRPVDVSPSIEQTPPWTPYEFLTFSSSADADLTASFEVPRGEVWELLAASMVNATTTASARQLYIASKATVIAVYLMREASVATGIYSMWAASAPIILYEGDSVVAIVSDPGLGDVKEGAIAIRRYYQRAPPMTG